MIDGIEITVKLDASTSLIPPFEDDSSEGYDDNFHLLNQLSLGKAYISHAKEGIPVGNKSGMVATRVEDSRELCSTQLTKKIEVTRNLVTLAPRGRTGNFRVNRNVVVLKPLDITKSDPSRLLFDPNEIKHGDTLTVYVRLRSVPEQDEFIRVPCTTSAHKCCCFESHPDAVFCVTAGLDPLNVVSWHTSQGENPRANISIQNLEFLRIEFAYLHLQSAMFPCRVPPFITHELVFRVEGTHVILEQTYFIKCSASPSRDTKPFLQDLYQYGLISREPKRKASQQTLPPHPSIFLHQVFPRFIQINSLSAEERKLLEKGNIQILNKDVTKPHIKIK